MSAVQPSSVSGVSWTPLPLWPTNGVRGAIGPADQPTLTPYFPTTGEAREAIIVCPGGGYGRLAPHEGAPIARWLNSLGIAAFVLHYRVAPHRHPTPLGDAQRAIRIVRQRGVEWGLISSRVGLLGFSAGGHLTASAGVFHDRGDQSQADPVERVSSRPDALVLCYPVISFGDFRHQDSTDNLLGPDATASSRDAVSLEQHVNGATPPTFLWHTADDASVPVEHSLLFASALRRQEIPFELHIYPHGRHGLGLAEEEPLVAGWTTLCSSWLATQGFGNGAA